MSRMTYDQYLRSPWWTARKAELIRYRGYRCERCGAHPARGLQVHHRTYARLYHEHPDDLELLCRPCHARHHGKPAIVDPFEIDDLRAEINAYLQ